MPDRLASMQRAYDAREEDDATEEMLRDVARIRRDEERADFLSAYYAPIAEAIGDDRECEVCGRRALSMGEARCVRHSSEEFHGHR